MIETLIGSNIVLGLIFLGIVAYFAWVAYELRKMYKDLRDTLNQVDKKNKK